MREESGSSNHQAPIDREGVAMARMEKTGQDLGR
jgi:hypothetical protein